MLIVMMFPQHQVIKNWLENTLQIKTAAIAIPSPVLSGFLRIATHSKIFKPPSGLTDAMSFLTVLLQCSKVEVAETNPT